MQTDVVIIGAGVLGVSLAYHLSLRGQRVVVVERERSFACHASGKNAGMARQLYRNGQLTDWAARSIRGWPEPVRSRAFRSTGSVVVGRMPPGHHPELFESRTVSVHGIELPAVYSSGDGLLDPHDLVSGLYALCDKQRVCFRFSSSVVQLDRTNGEWATLLDDGTTIRSPWVVNAAGAWLNEFLRPQLPQLVVEANPFARHLFVVCGWQRGEMPQQQQVGFYWDEVNGWYARHWDQTARLVSICDRVPAVPETFVPSASTREQLASALSRTLPEIAPRLSLGRWWFCFRTYTEDQLPIWGEDPSAPGFFWLGAFGGFGMSTSFAATEDAARAICGEPVSVDPQLLPTRTRPQSAHVAHS
ncbi:MAG: FAD-binding oxidoreductase [Bdellovibrionales bacterium]|nr:FAD-binding oxidoreductase [Bdellovibrionales bacterium]